MTSHKEYLECACTYPGHTIQVELYKGDVGDEVGLDPPELHVTLTLTANASFWKRVYYAFNYVLRPKYNAHKGWGWPFYSSLLGKKSVDELYDLLLAWTVLYKIHQRKLLKASKVTVGGHNESTKEPNS